MDSRTPSKEQVRSIVSDYVAEQYARADSALTPEAFDRLHSQLVNAAQAYERGPEMQRQAVCDAVMATYEFLKSHGFSGATLVPLNRVVRAMTDLCKQNRPDTLFCEKLRPGKSKRTLEQSVRNGHLAAFADAWLTAHVGDEGGQKAKLTKAARAFSGNHFGKVTLKMLQSARSYQRQNDHHELIYKSYEQMAAALEKEAAVAGGGQGSLRAAIEAQIMALNERAKLRQS